MNAATLLYLDNQWRFCEDGNFRDSPEYPRLDYPALLLSDFGASISGVSVLSAHNRYLDALISRRLRDDGQVDGETKVLIHGKQRSGGDYQVLYTAVPMETWQRLQAWALAQGEHCLLIPHVALMFRLLHGDDSAVVFHGGREFSLLTRQRGVLSYYAVFALSAREEDLREAVKALASRVPRARASDPQESLQLSWYALSAASPEQTDELVARFSEACGARVQASQPGRAEPGDAAHPLFPGAKSPYFWARLAVNPGMSQINYVSENALPLLARGAALAALAFLVWGGVLLVQAFTTNIGAAQDQEQARQILQSTPPPAPFAPGFLVTRAFVEGIGKAQAGVDPYTLLAYLREAARNEVHLLRIRVNDGITIEGWTESRGSDDALSGFVTRLRQLGFSPEAIDAPQGADTRRNGFFAYRLQAATAQSGERP
jgi:hypothetical protein